MPDDMDFLDDLNDPPMRRSGWRRGPKKVEPPSVAAAGWAVFATILVAILVVYAGVRFGDWWRNRPLTPAEQREREWPNGPKTYAEAAQLLEVETAMLGRLRVSRLLADERRDRAGDGFIPIDSRGDGTRARLARLDAEVAEWDRQIAAQAAKVERARQRKEELDR
jgi:hypothetical protein